MADRDWADDGADELYHQIRETGDPRSVIAKWLRQARAEGRREGDTKMRAVLEMVRRACLFDDDDGQIGITLDPSLPQDGFNRICEALGLPPEWPEQVD